MPRPLAFALTDQGMRLERACELFGVEHGKQKVKRHGVVTREIYRLQPARRARNPRANREAARRIRPASDPAASHQGLLAGLDR